MPPSEEEFDLLMQDHARRRQLELDESCRLYRPPVGAVLGEVREQIHSKPRGSWRRLAALVVERFQAIPAWRTSTVLAVAVGGVFLATLAVRSSRPEQMVAFHAVSQLEELILNGNGTGTQLESTQTSASMFSTIGAGPQFGLPENLEMSGAFRQVRLYSTNAELKGTLSHPSTRSEARTLSLDFQASGDLAPGRPASAKGTITLNAREGVAAIETAGDVARALVTAEVTFATPTNTLSLRRHYLFQATQPQNTNNTPKRP